MGLVISVPKHKAEKIESLSISQLCERVYEKDGNSIYIPQSGRLLDVLKIFMQHKVPYALDTEN